MKLLTIAGVVVFLFGVACTGTKQLSVNGKTVYVLETPCGSVFTSGNGIKEGVLISQTFEDEVQINFTKGVGISSRGLPAIPIKEINFYINDIPFVDFYNGNSDNLKLDGLLTVSSSDTLKVELNYGVPYYQIDQEISIIPSNYIFCEGNMLGEGTLKIKVGNPKYSF